MDFLSFLLILTSTIAGISTDIYLPAILQIQQEFLCSSAAVQMSVGLNFLIPTFLGLFFGPLSDSIGRRPVFIAGLLIHLISTVGCVFSNSIELFNLARTLQGMGSCAIFLVTSSIYFERFETKHATKLVSYAGTAFNIGIVLAPLLGGILSQHFGWRSSFILISTLDFGSLVVISKLLPETLKDNELAKFKLRKILNNYWSQLTNPVNVGGHLILSLLVGVNLLFLVSLPFIFISKLGMGPLKYAIFQVSAPTFGVFLTFIVRKLIMKKEIDFLIKMGLSCALVGSSLILLFLSTFGYNPYLIIIAYVIFTGLFPFLFPAIISKTISLYPRHKGSASAFGYSMRSGAIWLGSLVGSYIYDGTLFPAVYSLLLVSMVAVLIFCAIVNHQKKMFASV